MMSTRTSKTTNNKPSAFILFFLLQGFIAGIFLVVDAVPCFPDKETLKTATYGAIESWCFDSNLTDFSGLFRFSSKFNADISRWDVSSVTNMRSMVSAICHWKTTVETESYAYYDHQLGFHEALAI
jgi:bacterial surface protein 26-residue repeat